MAACSRYGTFRIERSLVGRESQDSRTTGLQVRRGWGALERAKARDYSLAFPARVAGGPARVYPHPGMEFRDFSFFSGKRVCRAEPGGMGRKSGWPFQSASRDPPSIVG